MIIHEANGLVIEEFLDLDVLNCLMMLKTFSPVGMLGKGPALFSGDITGKRIETICFRI